MEIKCIKCNKIISSDDMFCRYCGAKQVKEKRNKRGNGQGSVFKQKNGKWCCQITTGYSETGQAKRKTKTGFRTKKEAIDYLPKMTFTASKSGKITVLYEAIQPHLQKLSVSKQTHYKTAFSRLSKIHNADIQTISVADLQNVVDENTKTFYPAKDMKDLLSLIFERAIAEQLTLTNLSKYIELPENNSEKTTPFTEDDIKLLWKDYASGNRFSAFIILMIYTGMMPGEFLNLTVGDIDFENHRIAGVGLKTKKRKDTPMILVPIIEELLTDLMIGMEPNDKFFGKWEHAFYDEFSSTISRLGLNEKLRPYSCRHTTATVLANANISPTIIREIMRHSRITTTQTYIHINQEKERNAMSEVFKNL